MLFTVIHPTARTRPMGSFPRGWLESMEAWYERCENPLDVQYLVAVHESRWEEFWSALPVVFPSWGLVAVVRNTLRDCCVDQGNVACAVALGKIFVGTMDDLFPPQGWDRMIREALPNPDCDAVLQVRTGDPRDEEVFVPQILTRVRYERLGYVGHPSYESMCADDEFTQHARLDRIVVDGRHIRFEHRHPQFHTAEVDEVYRLEHREEAHREGAANLERRFFLGFPREAA